MPGGPVVHFAAVKIRVVGSGNLKLTYYGFDKILSQQLPDVPMTATNAREFRRLSNFQSERAIVRGETTEINEIMKVNDITVFAKPLWTEYPG